MMMTGYDVDKSRNSDEHLVIYNIIVAVDARIIFYRLSKTFYIREKQ